MRYSYFASCYLKSEGSNTTISSALNCHGPSVPNVGGTTDSARFSDKTRIVHRATQFLLVPANGIIEFCALGKLSSEYI